MYNPFAPRKPSYSRNAFRQRLFRKIRSITLSYHFDPVAAPGVTDTYERSTRHQLNGIL